MGKIADLILSIGFHVISFIVTLFYRECSRIANDKSTGSTGLGIILANEILHGSVTDLRFIKRTIGLTILHDINILTKHFA